MIKAEVQGQEKLNKLTVLSEPKPHDKPTYLSSISPKHTRSKYSNTHTHEAKPK